jgi:hypothetical protein
MQASMHVSPAQPIALAGRNEGSRPDCDADRRSLKPPFYFQVPVAALACMLIGKGLNEHLENLE